MLPRALWWAGALALAAVASAQDFHWGEFQWVTEDDAPQELPSFGRLSVPEVPEAMKEYSAPAYIEWKVFVPRKGRALHTNSAESAPWLDASEAFRRIHDGRVRPAQREGEAVDSEVYLQLIFNPAAADAEAPDAIPRLLRVESPAFPELPKGEPMRSRVFPATVEVDTAGRVTGVTSGATVAEEFRQPLIAAVKRWKFAPARQGGQPVAASLEVPVLFVPQELLSNDRRAEPPKVRRQTKPVYPMGLRMVGASGRVTVSFAVSVEGRVVDAWVVKSTHAGFDDAALEAVRKWQFEPGRVDGRPANMRLNVPIVFSIEGEKSFQVKRPKSFPEGMPEALRYDVPPEMEDLSLPLYPFEALRDGQKGEVSVGFVVDQTGRVSETRVVGEPPSPQLAEAAVAAIETFRFKPAAKDGWPSPALVRIELEFSPSGLRGHSPVSPETRRIMRLLEKSPERFVQLGDLDQIPKPVYRKTPVRPTSLPADAGADVKIQFVIDRNGVARVPRVLESSHPAAGAAAALAVSQWRFEPPRVAGKPVDALAQIPIHFKASTATDQ